MYHDQDLRKFKVFVVQSLSHLELFETPLTAAHQGLLFFTISWSYSNSCPLSWWYYLTILSSASPFSFCLQTFPASGSFSVSWLFTSGGQRIGASASASVLPIEYSGMISFRTDRFDLLVAERTLKSVLKNHNLKASILQHSVFLWSKSHIHALLLEKP